MDRKALLTILITAGVMLGWHFGYYAPRAEKNKQSIEAYHKMMDAERARQKASEPRLRPSRLPLQRRSPRCPATNLRKLRRFQQFPSPRSARRWRMCRRR